MNLQGKATQINFFNFSSTPMRAFHMSWFAFLLCFFGWFGLAPMLKVIREDLGLTTDQIVTTNMIAVASTVFARLLIGYLCDWIGPRYAYTGLLILGSIPVMAVGLSQNYETFLLMRMAIGAIGASFVITQYHTSTMFGPNCVGTANAFTAGWGNSGAGVTHIVMPFLFAAAVAIAGTETLGWRVAMIVPGIAMIITGIAYCLLTKDTPEGNFSELRARGIHAGRKQASGAFLAAFRDYRVWALFLIYGMCFGVELVIDSKVALYLSDYFGMSLVAAGVIGGLFGAMGLFARPLGGWIADKFGSKLGLRGRVFWLFIALFLEGLALMLFSRMDAAITVIPALILTGLMVHASCGATYAVVPFINRKATGAVSGIVGAGGNAIAVAIMFLFKESVSGLSWPEAFLFTGLLVTVGAFLALAVRFSPEAEAEVKAETRRITEPVTGAMPQPA